MYAISPQTYSEISFFFRRIHDNFVEKGFWKEKKNPLIIPTKLALIHDEVDEALREHRKIPDDMVHFAEELADIVIRVVDLAEHLNINLLDEIVMKQHANDKRPPMHGKKY